MKMTARNTRGFYFLINFCRRKLFNGKSSSLHSLHSPHESINPELLLVKKTLHSRFEIRNNQSSTENNIHFKLSSKYSYYILQEQKEKKLELLQPKRELRRGEVRSVLTVETSLSQNETKIRFMELGNLPFRVWKFQQNQYVARTKRLRTLGESPNFPDENSWKHWHTQRKRFQKSFDNFRVHSSIFQTWSLWMCWYMCHPHPPPHFFVFMLNYTNTNETLILLWWIRTTQVKSVPFMMQFILF